MISHVIYANGDHKSQRKASHNTIMVRTFKKMLYVINIWNNIWQPITLAHTDA